MHVVTRVDQLLLRRFGRSLVSGSPTLILHHTGRRSGQERTTPLIYLVNGADLVVVASKGGVDEHPAWFHNVRAMDATTVELPGGVRRRVRPRVAAPEEKRELWPRLVANYAGYEEYAGNTTRDIPVVVLEPIGD
jgi:deazaflavin-dependent oxidoreductase (nitroreductase family)